MKTAPTLRIPALLAVVALLAPAGCSQAADGNDDATDDALTSITARSRELKFEGLVYADRGASDAAILKLARKQSQTAFGALLALEVSVESREVHDVDPASFKKREVTVIDTDVPNDTGSPKLEVRYTYVDKAVVPVKLSRRTSLPLALLTPSYDEVRGRQSKIVTDCTINNTEAREDAADGLLWYDFNPSKASCKKVITDEQKQIDADRDKLTDKKHQVTKSEVERVYLPATFSLGSSLTAQGATYPEYDKLFTGGVQPGKLVIGMISGRLNHSHVEAAKDDGYYEWMDSLGVLFAEHPKFELTGIEPQEDLTTVTVGDRRIDGLKFADFIRWTVYEDSFPSGLSAAEKTELRLKIGKKLDNHWVTFQLKTKVKVGNAAPKDFTIQLDTLFGADEDPAPHKHAVRHSDVFIYNGHSYIGYGPLDPSNFRSSDFPDSYQLFFIDGCVSYNYYNEGYFLLKAGGTKKLDTITNGIEAPEYESGSAEGKMLSKLINGGASYKVLLTAAKATDPLRVVDGETDNDYSPSATPVKVEEL
jgi:hypothetical protein